MHTGLNEFLAEQKKGLARMLADLRESRVAAARQAAVESAARIKSLNQRVRVLASSGVRVTAASQGAVQGLIELQEEIVTSALTDAAAQIERLAYTESVRDLARVQAEVLGAARKRIVSDIGRTVRSLKGAASDVRKAAERGKARRPTKTSRTKGGKPPIKAQAKAGNAAAARTRVRRGTRKTHRRGRRATT
jgi:hypothetical protein